MAMSNLPAGVDHSHSRFHSGPDEIECPNCLQLVPAETGVLCACGCEIDDDVIHDFLDAVGEPDEDWGSER